MPAPPDEADSFADLVHYGLYSGRSRGPRWAGPGKELVRSQIKRCPLCTKDAVFVGADGGAGIRHKWIAWQYCESCVFRGAGAGDVVIRGSAIHEQGVCCEVIRGLSGSAGEPEPEVVVASDLREAAVDIDFARQLVRDIVAEIHDQICRAASDAERAA